MFYIAHMIIGTSMIKLNLNAGELSTQRFKFMVYQGVSNRKSTLRVELNSRPQECVLRYDEQVDGS
jgi:hypothetical protein